MAASTRICLAALRRTATTSSRSSSSSSTTTLSRFYTIRQIHISPSQTASVAPGLLSSAPPPPPAPQDGSSLLRPARRKRQAEVLRPSTTTGQSSSSSSPPPPPPLRRRFWQTVSVQQCKDDANFLEVRLDSRLVRHPTTKQPILIPASKPVLAHALAVEWDSLLSAQEATRNHLIPLTSLVCRAIDISASDDKLGSTSLQNNGGNNNRTATAAAGAGKGGGVGEIRKGIVQMLLRYLDTDTILCMAPYADPTDENSPYSYRNKDSKTLREVQDDKFREVVGPLAAELWPGVRIFPVLGDDGNSIFPKKQEEGTREVVQGYLLGLDAWELAGVERATLAGKSLLTAVRLVEEWKEGGRISARGREAEEKKKKRFGVEEAAKAVSVETDWQQARWGEVEDTHDVEREDVRRQFGSVVVLVAGKGE